MIPLRVLVVTERFWPLMDSGSMALEQVCQGLARRGHLVRVVTRRFKKYWSPQLRIGEFEVDRPIFSPRTRFGNLRIARQLQQYVAGQLHKFDLLLVDPTDPFGPATATLAARCDIPICFYQPGGNWETWSSAWLKLSRIEAITGPRSMWILPARQADQVRSAGANSESLCSAAPLIDGLTEPQTTRGDARTALADNHPLLFVQDNEPLVVAIGEWDSPDGLMEWIDAWRWIRPSFPAGRFWIVGGGRESTRIVEYVRRRQLTNEVLPLGTFDEWTELLTAADLFVQTEVSATPPFATLAAMQHGLPVLVNRGDGEAPEWLHDPDYALTYRPGEPRKMALELISLLERRSVRNVVAQRALPFVERFFRLDRALARIEQWALELVAVRENVQS